MLVLLVSSSILAGAAVVLLLGLLGVDDKAGTILTSVLLLVSTVLLCSLNDGARDALYAMDPRGSLSRVRSRETRRLGDFSYFAVGLLLAVVVELVVYLIPEQGDGAVRASAVVFATAVACSCLICFFAHYRSDFDLERVSKDYLALTCSIGFLPLPFVAGWLPSLVLGYLLCVFGLQLTLIIIAIIELARFEEISPLWYVGEGVYLFGGMCLGGLVAKACIAYFPFFSGVTLVCAIAILFTTFAQVLFNRFSYPEIELFRSQESAPLGNLEKSEGEGKRCLREERDGETSLPISIEDEPGKLETSNPNLGQTPRFRKRLETIEKNYGLSPRQCEILELLAKGRDTGYIIDHFHISKSTAKTHIYNIYLKFDIHSRQELIDLIESDEALEPPDYR